MKTITVLVIGFCSFASVNAQTDPVKTISLEEAVSTALQNNLGIQSQQLNVQSSSALKKSAFELPKTDVNFQFGQYNSIQNDRAFQLSQTIPFPTYFSAKSTLYKAELQGSQLQQLITENEIKAQVNYWYYQLQYLQQVQKKLKVLDSLYSDFVTAAELRYTVGETGLLEKTTAATKKGQVSLMLQQTEREMNAVYVSLKSLMNSNKQFVVQEEANFQPATLVLSLDSSLVNDNPSLKWAYQQAVIAEQNKKVETASTLPDISVGYFNQSLIGMQTVNGTDVFYDANDRFDGFNVGISIPLTFFSNASKIKSMDYKYQALQKEAESEKLNLQTQLQNAFQQYNQYVSQYNYFETVALPNAETIINTATLSFKSGDIGYIEYLSALQTATDSQLGYLQSVNQLNQAIININFLINK